MITILLKGGAKVTVDLEKSRVVCKCGKEILWAKTVRGKRMPIVEDKDGGYSSHFADCPYAKMHRGKPLYSKGESC